jgi:hypothetical protein
MTNPDAVLPEHATYEIDSVTFAPSDPPDGSWYTAISASRVFDEYGRMAAAYGYASDVEPNQEVVDRAISESVERAVVRLLYGRTPAAIERTTTGSAVHRTISDATKNARRELTAANEFIMRFHTRKMGRKLPSRNFLFMPQDTHIGSWIDDQEDLVFTALLNPRAQPKLAMGVRSCADDGWERAVDLCVVEVAQPRAWVRDILSKTAHPSSSLIDVNSPAERALYWSSVEDAVATATFEQLEALSHISMNACPPANTSPFTSNDRSGQKFARGEDVVASVRLQGKQGTLYFVRVEDDLSRGKYVNAEIERNVFWKPGIANFTPHPLI